MYAALEVAVQTLQDDFVGQARGAWIPNRDVCGYF